MWNCINYNFTRCLGSQGGIAICKWFNTLLLLLLSSQLRGAGEVAVHKWFSSLLL